jgi:hypothetical protein
VSFLQGLYTLQAQAGKIVSQVGSHSRAFHRMVGVTGLEPVTPRLSSACSNQLSYTPNRSSERVSAAASERAVFHAATRPADAATSLVELRRFELLTYSLQSYRSTN